MKKIWTMISVMAVANMLALMGFVGWLQATDRLDLQRVRDMRSLYTETLTEQLDREQLEADQLAEAEKAKELAAEEALGGEPIDSADWLRINWELREQNSERLERLRRDVEDLKRTLADARAKLNADIEAFEKMKEAFDAERDRIARIEGDVQFKKAVSTYATLKPAAAVRMMIQMMGQTPADGTDGTVQVVSYLNAMDERKRSSIIGEFEKTDPALAADLLERLRNYGLGARGPEDPGG